MVIKYKKGTVFKNIHTGDYFMVTTHRLNCGFPFYYLKPHRVKTAMGLIEMDDRAVWRLKQDEIQLKQHFIEMTPAAQILLGDK